MGCEPIRARRGGGGHVSASAKVRKRGQPDQRRPYDPICREAWVAPAYFVEGFGGGSKANGDANKTARAIELVAASNEGVAVLEAMAMMTPARRKFMVTLARALRDME